MASTLGASVITIGLVEGIGEATAAITKLFSGAISDFVGKRKFLVVLGYGMATLTKPIFPLARSIDWVLAARFLDRVGKGIRGAPRDALIADITPAHLTGAAYGLRRRWPLIGVHIHGRVEERHSLGSLDCGVSRSDCGCAIRFGYCRA
jgi:MFS family permease